MVDQAESMIVAGLDKQQMIDKDVVIEILPMLQEAQAIARERLFSLVPVGG